MKKVLFFSVFALALASCNNTTETTEVTLVDSTEVVIDSTESNSVVIDTMEVLD
jgi:uncharacterized protein YcfL